MRIQYRSICVIVKGVIKILFAFGEDLMETIEKKPKSSILLIPAIVSIVFIIVIVISSSSISRVFSSPMTKINSPYSSVTLNERGTWYVYQEDLGSFSSNSSEPAVSVVDPAGNGVPFYYTRSNTTLTINNRSYILIGSFDISILGKYRISVSENNLYLSNLSVGKSIGGIFVLVGGILGLVFFNIIFFAVFFIMRASNRQRRQQTAYGPYQAPGNYNYHPYYGQQNNVDPRRYPNQNNYRY